jgi:phospholipid/cholesterol/gamma-HCH transport system substrate-binding protein
VITSYVKKQLLVFGTLTLAAFLIIVFQYAKIPAQLGLGRMTVKALFTNGAGIYPNSNVTVRGVGIGQVKKVSLTPQGRVAVTMSIDNDSNVGADARAEIHAVSAVGEQYVDLISDQPGGQGPYLQNGSVIPVSRTTIPEQIAPVLDKTTKLLGSIPNQGLQTFLDEGYKAFANLGPDLGTLLDSSQDLVDEADQNYAQTAQLIQNIGPLLDTQNVSADSVRAYFANLAAVTSALRDVDPNLHNAFYSVQEGVDEVTKTLKKNDDPLHIATTNLRTTGKVLGVYRPGIEQILTTYPIVMAWEQVFSNPKGGRGLHAAINLQADQGCTTGFHGERLRNPEDLSDKDAEPNTYCKVPHNDPRLVRGVRNIPCAEGDVGMRAATVLECLGKDPNTDVTPGSNGSVLSPTLPVPGLKAPQAGPLTPADNQDDTDSSSSDPLSIFGGTSSTDTAGKEQTWQSLLTGPVGR